MWKKEYQDNRKRRIASDPEYAARVEGYRPSRTPEENKAYMRDYYASNRDKFKRTKEQQDIVNARRRERYATDSAYRDKAKMSAKRWQANNPDKRHNQRMRKYGITATEYNRILEEQHGGCAICGRANSGDSTHVRFHVDHCHSTGVVRGLLCSNCNTGIGKFEDDPDRLNKASMYLRACVRGEEAGQ